MNIFERLFRLIFPRLEEDERTEILRNLSDYAADLSCLENQYITFADRKAFTEKWNPVVTRTKNRAYVLVNGNRPSEFMGEFKTSRAVAIQSDTEQAMASEIACPRCKTGHLTVRKNESTNRYFVGCSHYPQCDYTVNDTSVMNEPKHCPRCGGFMVKRKGRYGTFYGCTNYPRCNYTERQENYRKPE